MLAALDTVRREGLAKNTERVGKVVLAREKPLVRSRDERGGCDGRANLAEASLCLLLQHLAQGSNRGGGETLKVEPI